MNSYLENENGQRDANERYALTDVNGNYSLANLRPGEYTVVEETPPGWIATTSSFQAVSVASTQVIVGVDFGSTVNTSINQAPLFEGVDPATGISNTPTETTIGQLLRYDALAIDPDGDPVTYSLPVHPMGMVVDSDTGVLVWNPTLDQLGTHDIILKSSDGRGGVDLLFFQVTVGQNAAPLFTSVVSEEATPQLGKPFQYQATAVDADGDEITYTLVGATPGITIDSTTGLLAWTPDQLGEQPITIKATDGNGGEALQTLNLEVVEPQANRNPEITSTPRTNTIIVNSYFYRVTANDPDGDPLTYKFLQRPNGMLMSDRGEIIFVPDAEQFGNHTVEIEVTDAQGGSYHSTIYPQCI